MTHELQSVLFDRQYWTIPKAKEWLKYYRLKSSDVRTTANHFRFRQTEPIGERYRVKHLDNGIELILQF